jgi:hypothetical protein
MPHGDHRPTRAHNHAPRHAAPWEAPRRPPADLGADTADEPDFDLVEQSFIEAAGDHSDPTSLIRLANIAFTRALDDGRTAHLLGFTIEHSICVGAAIPGFAGQEASFHPLPASRVERRRRVVFHYWTAAGEVLLTLAEARRPA